MLLVCCSNVESSPPFARSYMKKNPVALIRSQLREKNPVPFDRVEESILAFSNTFKAR